MSDPAVLDASALLALMMGEPGQDIVASRVIGGLVSAVNLSEVISRLASAGMPEDEALSDALALRITVVPFTQSQALQAAALRRITQSFGLSLGDRPA